MENGITSDSLQAIVIRLFELLKDQQQSALRCENNLLPSVSTSNISQSTWTDIASASPEPCHVHFYIIINYCTIFGEILDLLQRGLSFRWTQYTWIADVIKEAISMLPHLPKELDSQRHPHQANSASNMLPKVLAKASSYLKNLADSQANARLTVLQTSISVLDILRNASLITRTLIEEFCASLIWIAGEYMTLSDKKDAAMSTLVRLLSPSSNVTLTEAVIAALRKIRSHTLQELNLYLEEHVLKRLESSSDVEIQHRLIEYRYIERRAHSSAKSIQDIDVPDYLEVKERRPSLQLTNSEPERRAQFTRWRFTLSSHGSSLKSESKGLNLFLSLVASSSSQTHEKAEVSRMYQNAEQTSSRNRSPLRQDASRSDADMSCEMRQDSNGVPGNMKTMGSDLAIKTNNQCTIDIQTIPMVSLELSEDPALTPLHHPYYDIASNADLDPPHMEMQGNTHVLVKDRAQHSCQENASQKSASESVNHEDDDFPVLDAIGQLEDRRLQMQRDAERIRALDGSPQFGAIIKQKRSRRQISDRQK